ncbi:MAG: TIGR04282 family arsenosugar biosynthesis glycosyltransferase [Rudanella sp.]|nr:TIGR04282 family arsenosugar biosynthesis glycosyltransferase [Rudanella sp.]
MPDYHLLIFVKNPVPGTVKTRIARTVGNERATEVYRHLLAHTQQITRLLPPDGPVWKRVVYYGDFINTNDGWNGNEKRRQTGADLGERMLNAFFDEFAAGATRVVIIGSDCLAIRPNHLKQAFCALDTTDVALGPATDGGYYLLGMNQLYSFVFQDKPWSQPELLDQTLADLKQHSLTHTLLEPLTDIDEWDDYVRQSCEG